MSQQAKVGALAVLVAVLNGTALIVLAVTAFAYLATGARSAGIGALISFAALAGGYWVARQMQLRN